MAIYNSINDQEMKKEILILLMILGGSGLQEVLV